MTYSDHEQRQMDIQSGLAMDRRIDRARRNVSLTNDTERALTLGFYQDGQRKWRHPSLKDYAAMRPSSAIEDYPWIVSIAAQRIEPKGSQKAGP